MKNEKLPKFNGVDRVDRSSREINNRASSTAMDVLIERVFIDEC